MAIDLDLFSGSNYRSTIQRYCSQLGWNISDINDRRTIINFTMNSGSTQTLFIIRYDTTLEFSVPSGVKFNSDNDIPGSISTLMLKENSKYKIGFWSIEEINGRPSFSIMHNAEISLIDVLYFQKVVMKLIQECDNFEQTISKALRGY